MEYAQFKASLGDITSRVSTYGSIIQNEAQTRSGIIEPFIKALGYDVHNLFEVVPEYTSDVGVKKGEKVDYAINLPNQGVSMLIEVKSLSTQLVKTHINQLYRYFTTSNVKIAILTNGVDYFFFTDSERKNIMDLKPFYYINILQLSSVDEIFLYNLTSSKLSDFVLKDVVVRIEEYKKTLQEREEEAELEAYDLLFED